MSSHSGIENASQTAPNPATVLPIVLLVDVSNSMNTEVARSDDTDGDNAKLHAKSTRLHHLLRALDRLPEQLKLVGTARRGGEIAMITFGGGGVQPIDLRPQNARTGLKPLFVSLGDAELPHDLAASGHTPLAEALDAAAHTVRNRNRQLDRRPHYPANIWIITDGQNTEAEKGLPVKVPEASVARLRKLEDDNLALLFTAMLPGADERELTRITPESTYPVADADFKRITQLIAISSQSIADQRATATSVYARLNEMLR